MGNNRRRWQVSIDDPSAALTVHVRWDHVAKKWRLEAVRYSETGARVVLRATADSRVQVDAAVAQAFLRLLVSDLEARLL